MSEYSTQYVAFSTDPTAISAYLGSKFRHQSDAVCFVLTAGVNASTFCSSDNTTQHRKEIYRLLYRYDKIYVRNKRKLLVVRENYL